MLTQVTTCHGTYQIDPPADLMEYIPEFLNNREKDLEALKSAFAKDDYAEIFRLGHRIKGVCQPFGFEVLGRIAEDMESAAHREDKTMCSAMLSEYEKVLASVRVHLPPSEEAVSRPELLN